MKIYQTEIKKNPIDTTEKSDLRSNKYQFCNSQNLINYFTDKGFTLNNTSFANTKKVEKQGHQKHIMIFTRPDLFIDEGNELQLLVTNSHDATSSLRLNIGVYRTVCANGLVVGSTFFESRIKHLGNFIELLDDALEQVVARAPQVKEVIRKMQNTQVTFNQSQEFIKAAVDARLENIDNVTNINLATVDQIRRGHDAGQDVYTFFNRVQESIVRGGIQYEKRVAKLNDKKEIVLNFDGTPEMITKKNTTRAVKNISRKLELNQLLWDNAVKLAA